MQNYPVTREWNVADWLDPLVLHFLLYCIVLHCTALHTLHCTPSDTALYLQCSAGCECTNTKSWAHSTQLSLINIDFLASNNRGPVLRNPSVLCVLPWLLMACIQSPAPPAVVLWTMHKEIGKIHYIKWTKIWIVRIIICSTMFFLRINSPIFTDQRRPLPSMHEDPADRS